MRFKNGLLIALIVGAFLVTLLFFLPASLIASRLPATVQLGNVSGSLWHGAADPLSIQGQALGAVQWKVRPLQLLRGRVAVDASLTQGQDSLRGRFATGPAGAVAISDLDGRWSLANLPMRALPPGWTGEVQVNAALLEFAREVLTDARGTIELRNLREPPPSGVDIGSYRVTFDDNSRQGDNLVGRLEDIEGPMAVSGTITLSGRSYLIDGLVAARATTPAVMSDRLRYLGQPDAQGRRPFSVAGTY